MAGEIPAQNNISSGTAAPHTHAHVEPLTAEATADMETDQQDEATAGPTTGTTAPTALPASSTTEFGGETTAAEEMARVGRSRRHSAAAQAQAARAVAATASWKPNLDRRQSWSKEDQKHQLHMSRVEDVRPGCPGFSERG